jgi:hypothetical protein
MGGVFPARIAETALKAFIEDEIDAGSGSTGSLHRGTPILGACGARKEHSGGDLSHHRTGPEPGPAARRSPSPILPSRGAALAAFAVLCAGAAAATRLLSPDLHIGSDRGDWPSATAGLRETAEGLGGRERAVVHFHDLDGRPGELRLTLSSRDAAEPVSVTVLRDGDEPRLLFLGDRPTTIALPLSRGARDIDVRLEAAGGQPHRQSWYRIHEVLVQREATGWRRLAQALPVLIGLASLAFFWPRLPALSALAWSLLATGGGASLIAALLEPASALQLGAAARDGLRLAGLALLWSVALGRPSRAAAAAALAGTVAVVYLPTVWFGFLTDDFYFGRPLSAPQLLSTLYGHWDPLGHANDHYRPVTAISFALDYGLWGPRPAGYHLTNVVVHAAGALVACGLLAQLGLSHRASLAGALAWSIHPLAASAVAWVSERTDGLMALFYLACLLAAAAARDKSGGLGAVALGVLSLGAKEMALTLPAAVVLVAVVLGSEHRARLAVAGALAAAAAAHVRLWLSLFGSKAASTLALVRARADALGPPGLLLLVPALLAPIFVPVPYAYWKQRSHDWTFLAAGALAGPVAALLVRRWGTGRPGRVALLGLAWPFVTIAPVLGLRGDVDLYRLGLLPAFGFALLCAAAFAALEQRERLRIALALAVVVLLVTARAAQLTVAEWGPESWLAGASARWKRNDPTWMGSISPQMRRLFLAQVERREHARRWVERRPALSRDAPPAR